LLDVPLDALDRMRAQAGRFGAASLSRAADLMATALVDMRGTTSPRLVLELACARVLLPGAASDVEALLARLDRMEKRLAVTGSVAPSTPTPAPVDQAGPAPSRRPQVAAAAVPADPPPPVEAATSDEPPAPRADNPPPAAAPGVVDISALRRLWGDVLDDVKKNSRTAHALMMSSQIEGLDGSTLTISFQPPLLAQRFPGDVCDTVTAALKTVVGVDLKVVTLDGNGGAKPPATRPRRPSEAAAEAASESAVAADPEDELADSEDLADSAGTDPDEAALALLKEGLGAQVIGEIDQT
jgi:DNA polymerase-3 subunit gamma/tau